jgi:hypothetical protein
MSRRVAVVVGLLLVVAVVLLVIPQIQKARVNANVVASRNNLRELALFAAYHLKPDPQFDPAKLSKDVPPATVVLPGVVPTERLSWVVHVMPGLDQKRQDLAELYGRIDQTQPWAAERNQAAARTRLAVLLCPENTPQVPEGQPAVTCYAGVAGLGRDAATYRLVPGEPTPPRAGAFRYDAVTPFERIASGDGLSQTLLFGETADAPGPWLRGGPGTTRGLDDAPGAKPLLGPGGQFGGYFPQAAHFALCDGSVRAFTPQTTPSVLLRMATIDGGKNEVQVVD